MLVTQVEMFLSNADRADTAKMMDWLNHNEKFLFHDNARMRYGLHRINCNWYSDNITIQRKCMTGAFIDFRFTLHTYLYPHTLVYILHQSGWQIKARFRQGWIDNRHDRLETTSWRPWEYLCDHDFPSAWNPLADQARQEGRSRHMYRTLRHQPLSHKRERITEKPMVQQLTALLVQLRR